MIIAQDKECESDVLSTLIHNVGTILAVQNLIHNGVRFEREVKAYTV